MAKINGRITGRLNDGAAYVRSETGTEGVGYFTTQRRLPEIITKLCKLEDKIENGELVEVVRCKDCKYCLDMGMSGLYCEHPDGRNSIHCRADDFCNDGVKREA